MDFTGGDFASLLPSVFKGGLGIFQSILGAMNKPQRPVYQVPDSVREGTNIAETLASGSMPGKASIQGEIDKNAGTAINSLQESMGGSPNLTSAVANILAKNNEAKTALGVQDANFKVGAQENLIGQKNLEGQYEDKKQGDALDKFKESASASSALQGAGLSNMFSGLSDVAGVASYKSLYNSMFPQKKKSYSLPGTEQSSPTEGTTQSKALQDATGTFIDPNMMNKNGFSLPNLLTFFGR